jgi:hypothetical protein
MTNLKLFLVSLGIVFGVSTVSSANKYVDNYYFSLGVGSSKLTPINADVSDKSDTVKSITLGANITKNLAIDLSINNLGSAILDSGDKVSYKVNTLNAVYNVKNINGWTPFIKGGVRHISSNKTVIDTTDGYYGVGVNFDVNEEESVFIKFTYNDYAKDIETYVLEVGKKW